MAQVPFALVDWEEVEGLTETYWERNNKVKTIVFRILLLRRCHSWLRNQNSKICSLLMSLFSTTWFKVLKSELLQFVYEIRQSNWLLLLWKKKLPVNSPWKLGDRPVPSLKTQTLADLWPFPSTMELRVGNKYRLGRKIGSGSFGDIYLGTNISTLEEGIVQFHR